MTQEQRDNLKPWPQPVGKNPIQRPKHTTISDACRYLLGQPVPGDKQVRTFAKMIAAALIRRALQGDLRAVREVREIEEASAAESHECMFCKYLNELPQKSDEELDAIIMAYVERKGMATNRSQSPDSEKDKNEICETNPRRFPA